MFIPIWLIILVVLIALFVDLETAFGIVLIALAIIFWPITLIILGLYALGLVYLALTT
jgi:hypothetical protein